MKKKVLIVAYYWPPAGGPGVQRWLNFAKYLPQSGIEPVMFVPDNPSYPITDENLLEQVPAGIKVYRQKIWEPYSIANIFSRSKTSRISSGIIPAKERAGIFEKIALWIRGNVFIPDARIFWVGPSVSRIRRILKQEQIDTIITTGPPHSVHLIGLELQKRTGIKWIADFRDPWTTIGYHSKLKMSSFAKKRHRQLEWAVLSSADLIIATSRLSKREFMGLGARNVSVVTNGYQPSDIEVSIDKKFSIAHIGSLLSGRNPLVLWEALAELCTDIPGFADDLELEMVGTVSADVVSAIQSAGLEANLKITPYLPHREAVAKQRSAQILLLVEIDAPETRAILPGKLFEYMASGRPILAVGPAGSEMEEIIDDTRAGSFFGYDQKNKIRTHIQSQYESYKQGNLESQASGIEKYSRESTAKRLAESIREVWA